MHAKERSSFGFLVVTYNHQDYILEHLESIKYLVEAHGTDIDVDLIINDDCSKAETRNLVDGWLKINTGLFRHIKTLYNLKNLGTCASVNNLLTHVVADRCKLTAGDDVYSFENIFELTKHNSDIAMVSGRALHLLGDDLGVDKLSSILATSTQVIYQNDSLLHRFKHLSYNNAPNLQYAIECLLHPKVRAHLLLFDVVDDWPLQVAIARQFPERRFKLIDEVLVYYRRTPGSTYIVANKRFVNDKLMVYDDLIQHESNLMERYRLLIRKFCFKKQNPWVNKLLNLDFYIFVIAFAYRAFRILKLEQSKNIRVDLHRNHYNNIRSAANEINKRISCQY